MKPIKSFLLAISRAVTIWAIIIAGMFVTVKVFDSLTKEQIALFMGICYIAALVLVFGYSVYDIFRKMRS